MAVLGDVGQDGVSSTGRVGDHIGGGQAMRVLLEALHAEELIEGGLVTFGLRANPRSNATGRISKGIV